MNRAFKIVIIVVCVLVAGIVLSLAAVFWNIAKGNQVKGPIISALKETFPKAKVQGQPSYERRVIYFNIEGIRDREKRIEIKDWLTKYKTDHKIDWELYVVFLDDNFDNRVTFKMPAR